MLKKKMTFSKDWLSYGLKATGIWPSKERHVMGSRVKSNSLLFIVLTRSSIYSSIYIPSEKWDPGVIWQSGQRSKDMLQHTSTYNKYNINKIKSRIINIFKCRFYVILKH